MRLIDADKAKYSLWGFERYTGIEEMPMEYAEEIIDKQPTVEAIPIEWIEKRINTYILFYEEKKREPEIARLLAQGITVMSELLDDWRAENEPY